MEEAQQFSQSWKCGQEHSAAAGPGCDCSADLGLMTQQKRGIVSPQPSATALEAGEARELRELTGRSDFINIVG